MCLSLNVATGSDDFFNTFCLVRWRMFNLNVVVPLEEELIFSGTLTTLRTQHNQHCTRV
jgi:hypothetical protein